MTLPMKLLEPPRIFVVDDDVQDAERVSQMLRKAGYSVDTETDSGHALRRFTANLDGYDILVSDGNMPHVSGSQLVEGVRKAGFSGKVVMYSGSVSDTDEAAFKRKGADVVLRKPLGVDFLIPTIRICTAMLAQHRKRARGNSVSQDRVAATT